VKRAPTAPYNPPGLSPPPESVTARSLPITRRLPRWLGQAALVAALLFGLHLWGTRDAVRGPAPDLAGLLLDGRRVDLADYRGEPLLVHFWATWCPACRLEQGAVDAIARDHQVLTVAMQSGDAAELTAYLREQGVSFPVRPDEHGELAARWGVRGLPTSFVVDPEGNIRFVTAGVSTGLGLRLRLWLARG